MKSKLWKQRSCDPKRSLEIAQLHQISPLLAQILLQRKIESEDEIQKFLQPSLAHLPDPETMMGMEKAVARILKALKNHEKITIYGDYDVDGTTSTALLVGFFRELKANVDFYIPHRMKEGYSLNVEALKKIKASGTQVVITVDNGISAIQEARIAKSIGLDLIITDHHEVPETLPEACAILNPKQNGDHFPGKQLAGVGVAFYLLMGLRRALRNAGLLGDREPNLRQALDLVAIGTVADLAPLTGLNRVLVREGLKVLSRTSRPGLIALKEIAGVDGDVRSDQIAFHLGPRINAVGRLEEASLGVRLLLTENLAEAKSLAEQLNSANMARKSIEDEIVEQACLKIETDQIHQQRRSLIIFQEDWHPGVVGIVASRLVERYYLPAIVLTRDKDSIRGSARSIRNFHLVESLRDCAHLLEKFGGHAYAAGLSMSENNLPEFIEHFDQIVRSKLQEEDFQPALQLDVESQGMDLNEHLLEQLKKLEPFGLGNAEPLLLLKNAQVSESRVVGEKHLKLRVEKAGQSLGAIAFRLAAKKPEIKSQIDLAFFPEWNEWNGTRNLQLRVVDLRSS